MDLSPKQIVTQLDKYIIGQEKAKKAVAIALRNRYRRSKLEQSLREEITPKNIILKGPTGVGKTEIARRLARLVKAPFIKVEATKFTEVGYVGRDVESMIRDLVEASVHLVKEEKIKEVQEKATPIVNNRLLDVVFPIKKAAADVITNEDEFKHTVLERLIRGDYDEEIIELEVKQAPKQLNLMPGSGVELDIGNIFGDAFGGLGSKKKKKKMTVKQAREILMGEESDKLIDLDTVNSEAIRRAEQEGIIFIDEIDKVASKGTRGGPDVSREGVQRDILPIVEGCTISTKYGTIRTDFILFIAAGAFHVSKVEDLIPEFQGRFPIMVELNNLTKNEFLKILTEPENAVTLQYKELLKVDNINLIINEDALEEIADFAEKANNNYENLGARRLHTIMEALLEDISFNASGDHPMIDVVVDREYVKNILGSVVKANKKTIGFNKQD